MYCGTCGKELRDGAKFCDECGAVQPAAIPESQQPKTEPEAVAPVEPVIPVVQTPEKPRKKVNKKLLAVVAIVLVVAVVAAIVIPIFFPRKERIYIVASETRYDADGNKTAYYVYDIDEYGNLLSMEYDHERKEITKEDPVLGSYTDYTYEFDGKYQTSFEGEYNENCDIESWLYQYGYGFSVEYEYDEDDRIAEFVITMENPMEFDSTDAPEATPVPVTYECEYDDEGRLVRVFIPDGFNGDDFTTPLYAYDKAGQLTAVYWSSKEGTSRNDLYYEDDLLASVEYYESPTPLFQSGDESGFQLRYSVYFDYDKNGTLVEAIRKDEYGQKVFVKEWEYSKEGFLEEITVNYTDGDEFTTEYTCDEYGNIIEIEYSDGSRTVYEYEERKLTSQQAQIFRRLNKSYPLDGYIGDEWRVTCRLVPNPMEGQY